VVGRLGVALLLMGGAACLEAPPSGGGTGGDDGVGIPTDGGPVGPCVGLPSSSLVDDFVVADGLAGWDLTSTDPSCILCNHTDDVFVENTSATGQCSMRTQS
jgi:hypothetical protein